MQVADRIRAHSPETSRMRLLRKTRHRLVAAGLSALVATAGIHADGLAANALDGFEATGCEAAAVAV